jgi:polyphosphate kinase
MTDVIELLPPNQRYLNRERSWLAFNHRVLEEAQNPAVPLLERVRFLAICDNNLDEFTTVRAATLKNRLADQVDVLTSDGLTLKQQLSLIYDEIEGLLVEQQETWNSLRQEMVEAGIRLVLPGEIEPDEWEWLQTFFMNELLPLLTPLACDPAHPFPFIPNDGLCMGLKLRDGKTIWSLLPLPPNLPRFIKLGSTLRKEPVARGFEGRALEERYLLIEDAVPLFFDRLLPNFKVKRFGLFHVLRDAEMEMETTLNASNLADAYLSALKGRRRGDVIRLTFNSGVPDDLRQFITGQLNVDPEDVFEMDGLLNLSDLTQLTSDDRPELKFPHFDVRFPERIKESRGDYFAAIANKDFVVHHPYESFDAVVEFLRQAARDPDVLAIKQTLYRTSRISDIVRALIEAAESGKSVTVVVELKARFDEERNIRLARDLQRAGANIVYGFVDLKTHAKMTLVMRKEAKGLRGYVHFGTGNYHPVTAKSYTDLSFFTGDEALVRDAGRLFNYLTGYATPSLLEKLYVSPLTLKKKLLHLIQDEIDHVQAGRPGEIWAKMNSLVDSEICDALYRASQAGVKIELVVRGICCLRPGLPGLSENIRVKSIVGRFLEHARICCFGNGKRLPHKRAKVYISSADWMPRNFHSRVETLIPIETDSIHAQLLDQVMLANLKDTRQSWYLGPDGRYRRDEDRDGFCAHEYFIHNPSLSGRGRSRQKGRQAQILSLDGLPLDADLVKTMEDLNAIEDFLEEDRALPDDLLESENP